MLGAAAILGLTALFILSDQYQWARYTLGGIIFMAFVLFLLLLH